MMVGRFIKPRRNERTLLVYGRDENIPEHSRKRARVREKAKKARADLLNLPRRNERELRLKFSGEKFCSNQGAGYKKKGMTTLAIKICLALHLYFDRSSSFFSAGDCVRDWVREVAFDDSGDLINGDLWFTRVS